MTKPFGARLRTAMDARGPLCVGIDPHAELLDRWGLPDDVSGLESFASTCVDAFADQVAVLKPQSAFFERYGSAGIAVLERFVVSARGNGALVLLDAKRSDIGSTMRGYAEAYLATGAPLAVDALTVNPFLGFESLRPALDVAQANCAGVFVLALTSNPEGGQVQHARTGSGTVAGDVLTAIRSENHDVAPLGSVGAVVAANLAGLDEDVAINGPLLAPGFGAQGGSPDDLRRLFADVLPLVLPTTSRSVLRAGPDVRRLRDAVQSTIESVCSALR